MDFQVATVLELTGRNALVQVERAACSRCRAGKGCGAGLFARPRGTGTLRVRIAAGIPVAAGDRVTIVLAGHSLIRAAMYLYCAPLIGLLVAAAIAYVAYLPAGDANDAISVIWALTGLAVGSLAGAILARRDKVISSITPIITGRAPRESEFTSA